MCRGWCWNLAIFRTYGQGKPQLEEFLRPFVNELLELLEEGLKWDETGKECPIEVFLFVCDAPQHYNCKLLDRYFEDHLCNFSFIVQDLVLQILTEVRDVKEIVVEEVKKREKIGSKTANEFGLNQQGLIEEVGTISTKRSNCRRRLPKDLSTPHNWSWTGWSFQRIVVESSNRSPRYRYWQWNSNNSM